MNTVPVSTINTSDFITTIGNTFTVDGSGSYDPDGYEVYYHWEAADGMGLGCADGISSTEIDCCEKNSINCADGNADSEQLCCEESFGVWNVTNQGDLGDICDVNCCYTTQNPWVESYWDNDAFCLDSVSLSEEDCCTNNG